MSASIRLLLPFGGACPVTGTGTQIDTEKSSEKEAVFLHRLELEVALDIGERRDDECCDPSRHECLDQLHAWSSFRASLPPVGASIGTFAANMESSISWRLRTWWMMSTRRATAGSAADSAVALRPRPCSMLSVVELA